jgi:flagellar motor switch protein FliN/FliY
MKTMSDYLSQEEIDALLKQSSDDDSGSGIQLSDILTDLEVDALGEIGNITFGSAATALSTLLGKKVDITTPKVSAIESKNLGNEFPKPHVAVHVKYVDGFQGINSLVIKTIDAQVIADLMLGGDGLVPPEELNEIHVSAVQEAMNQMMGSSATSMSTIFNRFVNISPPGIDILNFSDPDENSNLPDEDVFVKISFRLIIEDLIDSTIMQLLPVHFAKSMVDSLMGGGETSEEAPDTEQLPEQVTEEELASLMQSGQSSEEDSKPFDSQSVTPPPPPKQQTPPPSMPPQPMHMPQSASSYGNLQNQRNINVQPIQYSNFAQESSTHSDDVNLNLLLDIPLRVTVELGRTKRLIKDILEFTQGSIIELDKLAGEPVDILVNNKLIAKGEVVVIDENFGVRVTDIVSQIDRVHKLQ